jgi:hypothetical protein
VGIDIEPGRYFITPPPGEGSDVFIATAPRDGQDAAERVRWGTYLDGAADDTSLLYVEVDLALGESVIVAGGQVTFTPVSD